jgi:hypothetical protein
MYELAPASDKPIHPQVRVRTIEIVLIPRINIMLDCLSRFPSSVLH